jgi:hypothetical protein
LAILAAGVRKTTARRGFRNLVIIGEGRASRTESVTFLSTTRIESFSSYRAHVRMHWQGPRLEPQRKVTVAG